MEQGPGKEGKVCDAWWSVGGGSDGTLSTHTVLFTKIATQPRYFIPPPPPPPAKVFHSPPPPPPQPKYFIHPPPHPLQKKKKLGYSHLRTHTSSTHSFFLLPSPLLPSSPPQVLSAVVRQIKECWRYNPHAWDSSVYLKYALLKLM